MYKDSRVDRGELWQDGNHSCSLSCCYFLLEPWKLIVRFASAQNITLAAGPRSASAGSCAWRAAGRPPAGDGGDQERQCGHEQQATRSSQVQLGRQPGCAPHPLARRSGRQSTSASRPWPAAACDGAHPAPVCAYARPWCRGPGPVRASPSPNGGSRCHRKGICGGTGPG